jgi:Tfp pilus assembly protein PilV
VSPTVRQRLADEAGNSLLEVLIASMIFAIAGLALVGGFGTAAVVADVGAKQATIETAVRSAGEQVRAAPYSTSCPVAYPVAAPAGFSASVTQVRHFRAEKRDLTTADSGCQPTDTQVVSIRIVSADGRASGAIDVTKRPS